MHDKQVYISEIVDSSRMMEVARKGNENQPVVVHQHPSTDLCPGTDEGTCERYVIGAL